MDKEERWRRLQKRLGYTDEELAILRSRPKYVKMVEETPQFIKSRIIAEVVSSRGCICQFQPGDRIVMDGNGHVLSDECPKRMCIWALAPLAGPVNAVFERFVAQLDPNALVFDVVSCQDVGVECGGWGRVLMKIRVEDAPAV